jgi:hypothetical protein
VITIQEAEAAIAAFKDDDIRPWGAIFERVSTGEACAPEVVAAAARERSEREARLRAIVDANTIGKIEVQQEFLRLIRDDVEFAQAAKAVGSTLYLVVCRCAEDHAFREALGDATRVDVMSFVQMIAEPWNNDETSIRRRIEAG